MFTWRVRKEAITTASAKDVWNICTNFEQLPKWNDSVNSCTLFGPLAVGTKGEIIMKGQPPIRFTVQTVEEERLYRDKSRTFGATFVFSYEIIPLGNGVRVVNTFQVSGFLAPLLKLIMKKKLEISMQSAIENLINLAESR